jgi:hypothetical protein
MTIWTNLIVALFFTSQVFFPNTNVGRFFSRPSHQAAIVIFIFIVGAIYHLLLAKQWNPQGWAYAADQMLHTAVPIYYILYWIFFAEKQKLTIRNAFNWLLYPLTYIIYSLIRGAVTGKYPYYFIDVSKLGYGPALENTAFIGIAYFVFSVLLIIFNNRFAAKEKAE